MAINKIDLKKVFAKPSKLVDSDLREEFEEIVHHHRSQVAQVAISVAVIIWLTSYVYDLVVYPDILIAIWTIRTIVCVFLVALTFLTLRFFKDYPFGLLVTSLVLVSAALSVVLVYANDEASPYIMAYVLFLGTAGAILDLKPHEAILGFLIVVSSYIVAALFINKPFNIPVAFSIATHCGTMCLWSYLVSRILTIISYNNLQVTKDNEEKTKSIRLQNMELKKLHEEKTKLLANISHEFRTPLTLILSPISNIRDETTNEKIHQYLNVAEVSGLRLLRLVNNLLDSFYAESNGEVGLKEDKINLDLDKYLSTKVKEYELLADSKGLTIEFSGPNEGIAASQVYLDEFAKVISNIIVNAIKFTERGSVEVCLEKGPENNIITISDSGVGVRDDELEKIFNRFYTGCSKNRGVGIGLNLAKLLVTGMGGDIYAVQNKPSGLKIILTMPVSGQAVSDQQPEALLTNLYKQADRSIAIPSSNRSPITKTSSKNVLVVEDEMNMRNFIVSIFEKCFNVIAVDSAENALSVINDHEIDLVITDYMLSNKNGLDLTKEIRRAELNCGIMMLTANQDKGLHDVSLAAGVDSVFIKPFDKTALFGRACELLGESPSNYDKNKYISTNAPAILIVEDNTGISKLIESSFDSEVKLLRANSAESAIEILNKWTPDIVTLDIRLSKGSEEEILNVLKKDKPDTRIIAITDSNFKKLRLDLLEFCDDVIVKPYDIEELKARLRYQIGESQKSKYLKSKAMRLESLKDIEVQKERLALIGELNMNVMHEIKNPLNFSLIAISLVNDKTLKSNPDFVLEACKDIGIGLEQIKNIVDDIQSTVFKQTEKALEEVALDSLIGQSIHIMQPKLAGIDVQVICPAILIKTEKSKLSQVFINLIDNAIAGVEQSDEKTIFIRVSEQSDYMVIMFSDTGTGIGSEHQNKLFDKFYTTKKNSGTGVGLPLSKSIIESMGGSLSFVENNPGAVFEIKIPKVTRVKHKGLTLA